MDKDKLVEWLRACVESNIDRALALPSAEESAFFELDGRIAAYTNVLAWLRDQEHGTPERDTV